MNTFFFFTPVNVQPLLIFCYWSQSTTLACVSGFKTGKLFNAYILPEFYTNHLEIYAILNVDKILIYTIELVECWMTSFHLPVSEALRQRYWFTFEWASQDNQQKKYSLFVNFETKCHMYIYSIYKDDNKYDVRNTKWYRTAIL